MYKLLLLIILILAGYLLSKYNILKSRYIETLSKSILYLFTPALSAYSISNFAFQFKDIFWLITIILTNILIVFIIAKTFFLKLNIKSNFYLMPIIFANTGNLGYPINLLFFGKQSLPFSATFNVVIAVLIFTIGVYFSSDEKLIRKRIFNIFKLPVIYAYIAGIFLKINEHPVFIDKTLFVLSIPTIPIMLIIFGSSFHHNMIQFSKKVRIGLYAKLLSGILTTILIILIFNIDKIYVKVALINIFMPSAIMNYIFAVRFNKDKGYVANMIAITTIAYILIFIIQALIFY